MNNTENNLKILTNGSGANTDLLNTKASHYTAAESDAFKDKNDDNNRDSNTTDIDLNSHHEVFQAILQQVSNTPHELVLLNVLHNLLRIDPNEELSSVIWNVTEKLVYRATQLQNMQDAQLLLNATVTHTFTCQKCNDGSPSGSEDKEINFLSSNPVKQSVTTITPSPIPNPNYNDKSTSSKEDKEINLLTSQSVKQSVAAPISSSTPPLTSVPLSTPPPPPPLPPSMTSISLAAPPPPPPPIPTSITSIPLAGPPPPPPPTIRPIAPAANTPISEGKLKPLKWSVIPHNKVNQKSNIWTTMAKDYQNKCIQVVNFKYIEGLFYVAEKNKNDQVDGGGRIRKRTAEALHVFDSKTSLNINIVLSQFKSYNSYEDIVQLIRNCDHKAMGLENLNTLNKFFQNDENTKPLQHQKENRHLLANAEKFIFLIIDIPDYKLRIECMKLRLEFTLNMGYFLPSIQTALIAGQELMKSQSLQVILGFIIIIGNFLNSRHNTINAIGIKLSSLNSLKDIRTNKSGMHCLHVIAMEVERFNPQLLDLSNELKVLENVNRVNIEQTKKDINAFCLDVNNIKTKLNSNSTTEDLKQQMSAFIRDADAQIENLNKNLKELEDLRITVAEFFCEDLINFKLDECFAIFFKFCRQFKQAVEENEKRLHLEQHAVVKQKLKEEQMKKKATSGQNMLKGRPKRLTTFRSYLTDDNTNFIASEGTTSNVNLNAKKNEHDLMDFLQSQQPYECHVERAKRDKFRKKHNSDHQYERERSVKSKMASLLGLNDKVENKLLKDHESKWNVIKKSWGLILNIKGTHLKDKCLTPDLTPRRESLRIYTRSSSTVDNKANTLRNQSPVVANVNTTLLQNNTSVFQSGADNDKTKDIPDLCARPTNLNTKNNIRRLGRRYSSINDEDLRITIKNLRTPTPLQGKEFCWSPMREQPPRIYPISPLAIENNSITDEVFEEQTEDNLTENRNLKKKFFIKIGTNETFSELPRINNRSKQKLPQMDFKRHKTTSKSVSSNETNVQKIKNVRLVLRYVMSSPLKPTVNIQPSFRSYIDVKSRTDILDKGEKNL